MGAVAPPVLAQLLRAGNAAATSAIHRAAPRGVAAGPGLALQRLLQVQRETRAEALAWLRQFLALRAGALSAATMAAAATRLAGWSTDRATHLVNQVRGSVDGFEVAVGDGGLLADPAAGRVLGLLEGTRTTDDLGARLATLFAGSLAPSIGLVIAANLPEDRLRAALQAPGRAGAIADVLRRNPVAGLAAGLVAIRSTIATIGRELAAPTTEGVTPSDAARETRVEQILTPPAVANARAAAAAAGAPPPAFVPAGYYEDLVAGLHIAVQNAWGWAEPMDRRRPLDVRPGGHVEGIAAEAKGRVDALYGAFGSAPAPAMTFAAGNLEDRGAIAGDPFDMARWFVREGSGTRPSISAVQLAHHSFEDAAAAQAIEDRVIGHYSGRSAPAAANETAALAALGVSTAERSRRLTIIDRMWPGVQSRGTVSVAAREGATARATRAIYWGLFKTMVHEYLHTTAHATYTTWYEGLRDSHHVTTYQEGFTDLFTLRTWQSLYPAEVAANPAFRMRIQGPADRDLDMAAVGGAPGHYAELAEAQQIEGLIGPANMKAAYFRGNTAVLGGGRLPR
ncbi:MAG: hypothetical protein V9F82_01645 [Dermatophilaceae bacterium]